MRLPSKRFFSRAAWLATAAAISACQDAGDPTALTIGEDVHPAVALAARLPSLPGLAAEGRLEPELSGAIDAWVGSWDERGSEAEQQRAAAYADAARALGEGLGRAGVADALGRVEAALAAADRLRGTALPEAVALRLAAAREEAGVARRALDQDALTVAVHSSLHAADLLREVGTEGVALTLIARAEGGLTWAGGPADPVAIARAERLVGGAREAAAHEDFALAIQRAWYACQLLGVALQ